jgi:hypothetical protein
VPKKTDDKKTQPRRSGQIIPRGPDRWLIRIFLGRDAQGKRRYSSKIFHGPRKEAEKELRAQLRDLDAGTFVEVTDSTLNEFLDQWLVVAENKVAERTYEDYSEILQRYVRPEFGAKALASIKAHDIQLLYTKMLNKGLSSRTVRLTTPSCPRRLSTR